MRKFPHQCGLSLPSRPREMKSSLSEAECQSEAFMVDLSLCWWVALSLYLLAAKKCAMRYSLDQLYIHKIWFSSHFWFLLFLYWLVIARTYCTFYANLYMWLTGFWRTDGESLLHFCSSRHRPWARGLHFVDSWVRVCHLSHPCIHTPVRVIRIKVVRKPNKSFCKSSGNVVEKL